MQKHENIIYADFKNKKRQLRRESIAKAWIIFSGIVLIIATLPFILSYIMIYENFFN